MAKYSIGDTVLIRSDLDCAHRYAMDDGSLEVGVNDEMVGLRGMCATIIAPNWCGQYVIDIDDGVWSWTDEMFEDVTTMEDIPAEAFDTLF